MGQKSSIFFDCRHHHRRHHHRHHITSSNHHRHHRRHHADFLGRSCSGSSWSCLLFGAVLFSFSAVLFSFPAVLFSFSAALFSFPAVLFSFVLVQTQSLPTRPRAMHGVCCRAGGGRGGRAVGGGWRTQVGRAVG